MAKAKKYALLFLVLLPLFLTLLIFPLFPDLVPTYGTMSTLKDFWGTKYYQLIFPGTILVYGLAMILLLRLGGKHWSEKVQKVLYRWSFFSLLVLNIVNIALLTGSYAIIASSNESDMQAAPLGMVRLACLTLSVVIMFFGNRLPTRPEGSSLGIRTRWTQIDSEIWEKTHKLAGPLYVFAGLFGLVLCAFLNDLPLILCCVALFVLPVLAAVYYSWSLWKRKYQK